MNNTIKSTRHAYVLEILSAVRVSTLKIVVLLLCLIVPHLRTVDVRSPVDDIDDIVIVADQSLQSVERRPDDRKAKC